MSNMNSFEDDVGAKDGCSTILDTIMKLTSQVSTKSDVNDSGNSFYSERAIPTNESKHTSTVNDILSETMDGNQDSTDKDCIKSNMNNPPRLMPDLEHSCLIKETESINNPSTVASSMNVHENTVTDKEEKVSENSVNGSILLSEETLWSGREYPETEVEKYISTTKNSNSLAGHPNSIGQEAADRTISVGDSHTDVPTQHGEKIEMYHTKNLLKAPDSLKVNDSFVSSIGPNITCEISGSGRVSKQSEKKLNHESLKSNSSNDSSPINTKTQTLQCTDEPIPNLSHSPSTDSVQTSIESKQCLGNPVAENSQDFIPVNTASESPNSEECSSISQPKSEISNTDKSDVISLQENSNDSSDSKIELKNLKDEIFEGPKNSTTEIEKTYDSEESNNNSNVYQEKEPTETLNSQLIHSETALQEGNTKKLPQSDQGCMGKMKEKSYISPKNVKNTDDSSASVRNILNDGPLSCNNPCLHSSSTLVSDTKNLVTEEVRDDFKILKEPENDLEDSPKLLEDLDTKVASTNCPSKGDAKDGEQEFSTVLNSCEKKESVCEDVLKTVSSSLELKEELKQNSITCSEDTQKDRSVSNSSCSTNGVEQKNIIDKKSLDVESEKGIVPGKATEEVELDECSKDVASQKLCNKENSDAKLIIDSNDKDDAKEKLERVTNAAPSKQNEAACKEEVSTDISSNLSKESTDKDDESSKEGKDEVSTDISSNLSKEPTDKDESTKEDKDEVSTDISSNLSKEPTDKDDESTKEDKYEVSTDISSNLSKEPTDKDDESTKEDKDKVSTDISSNLSKEPTDKDDESTKEDKYEVSTDISSNLSKEPTDKDDESTKEGKDEVSTDISSNLSKEPTDKDDESTKEDADTQSTGIDSAQIPHDEATKMVNDNSVGSFTGDRDINTLERKTSRDEGVLKDDKAAFSHQGKRKRDFEEEDDSSSNSKSSFEGKRKRDFEEEDDISSKRTKTDSESSLPEDIFNEDEESSHSIIIGEAFTINEEQMKEFDDASDCDVKPFKPSDMCVIPAEIKEAFTSEGQDDSQDSSTKKKSIFKESLLRTTKKVGQGGLKTSHSPSKISGKAKTKTKRSALFTPKKRKKQSDFSRKTSDFVSPTSPIQRRFDVLPAFLQEIAAIDPSLVVFRERLNEEGTKVRVSCIVFHESVLDWAFVDTLLSSYDNTKSLRSRFGTSSRSNILFPESSTMESKIDLFHPVHLEKSFPFAMPNIRTKKEEKASEMKLPFPLEQLSLLCPSSVGRRNVIKPDGKSGSLQAVTFADEPLEWAFKETFLSSFEDAPILSDLLGLSSSTRKWPDVAEEILANENVDFSFPFACPTSRRNFENLLFGELSFSLPSSLLHETLQLPPLPSDLERNLYGERDALVRLLALASFYKHISFTPTVRSNRKLSISHSALISSFRPLIISQANNFAICIKDVRARLLKGVSCQDGSIIPALIKGPMHTRRGFIFSNVQKLEAAVSKDPNNKLQYA